MNKDIKIAVPKLRFPEFKNDDGWEEKLIEEIATFLKGKGISKSDITLNGILPCIRYGELYTHYNETINSVISHTNLSAKSLVLSRVNDVIIPSSGETQEDIATASCVLINGVALGGDLNIIRTKMNGVFLSYYLNNAKKKEISQLAQGIAVVHLYLSQLQKLKISIPSKKEQQKIADCLASIDDLINAESQKLDNIKEHKKGLLQQLFPTNGETVPKLRFPEFKDDGDWEEKQLGGISEIVRGGSPRPITDFLTTDIEGLNWLKIGDVDKESKYVIKTAEKVIKGALNKTREVNIGDLIMSNSMSFGRPYILKIKTCIHDGWIAVTNIPNNIDTDFLYYIILSNNSQRYFSNAAAGGGVRNLNADIIKLLPLLLPPQKTEQQKIANCLSSVDEIISAQSQKVEALKEHKKGLMQQLFPNVNS